MFYTQNLLNKTKIEPDTWFFYGFLLSFSFSIRKVLFYFPIQGTFNEYTGIYVYISDVLLFFTMLSWIILILSNKQSYLSNYRLWITQLIHRLCCKIALELKFLFFNHSIKLPHNYCKNISTNKSSACSTPAPLLPDVPHGTSGSFTGWNIPRDRRRMLIIIPLILIMWSFISITWSSNQNIAFFRSIKLFEYYLLYLYIALRFVPRLTRDFRLFHVEQSKILRGGISESFTGWNNLTLIIITIALLQSFIGIIQFIIQHSIGLFWLKESLISPDIAGVAKIVIDGHKYIRSYGLFPHPNILGGFLLFSIIITLLYKRMFHTCPVISKSSTWNIWKFYGVKHFLLCRTTINILMLIQSLALFLTFSKSAIIGLMISLLYIYYAIYFPRRMFHVKHISSSPLQRKSPGEINVPRGTLLSQFRDEPNRRFSILIFLILIIILYLSWNSLYPMLYDSIQQRALYLNVSPSRIATQSVAGGRGTIEDLKTLFFGIGQGQFVLNMPNYVYNLELWQFQPVHNVFLLIWSELGIIGLGLCIYWLYKMFHTCPVDSYCSTWNNKNLYGVEHSSFLRGGTTKKAGVISNKTILQNKSYYLSNDRLLCYFKAILLGFVFIMLFDHYFWDIQQGNIMLWMILGLIAGIKRNIT